MGWERSKDWDQLCSHAETRGGSSRAFQGRWRWLPVELGGSLVRPHGHGEEFRISADCEPCNFLSKDQEGSKWPSRHLHALGESGEGVAILGLPAVWGPPSKGLGGAVRIDRHGKRCI